MASIYAQSKNQPGLKWFTSAAQNRVVLLSEFQMNHRYTVSYCPVNSGKFLPCLTQISQNGVLSN